MGQVMPPELHFYLIGNIFLIILHGRKMLTDHVPNLFSLQYSFLHRSS